MSRPNPTEAGGDAGRPLWPLQRRAMPSPPVPCRQGTSPSVACTKDLIREVGIAFRIDQHPSFAMCRSNAGAAGRFRNPESRSHLESLLNSAAYAVSPYCTWFLPDFPVAEGVT